MKNPAIEGDLVKNIKVYFVAFAAMASLLAGCGKTDPAVVVRQRAMERWNLLIDHQAVKAYDYLSPGYRTTHTLEQYVAFIATARLQWKSVEVIGQKCEDDACEVKVLVKSVIPGQLAGVPRDITSESPVSERWIASDGQWYFLPDIGSIHKAEAPTASGSDEPARAPGHDEVVGSEAAPSQPSSGAATKSQ